MSFTASVLKPEGVPSAAVLLASVAIVDYLPVTIELRLSSGLPGVDASPTGIGSDSSYRRGGHQTSFASSVISALKSFETGQFFSASPASCAKDAASRLGTLARSVSADLLILNPWPSGSSVTAASVASSSAEKPARSSWKASAMVKHP